VPAFEQLEGRTHFSAAPLTSGANFPRPDHIVIVMEENRSYNEILGSTQFNPFVPPPIGVVEAGEFDPFIRTLAHDGANLTDFHAERHPSQPNYIALFSGATQGVTSDAIPEQQFAGPSLGGQLIAAGLTFAGYSEDQPSVGYMGTTHGYYARKHNPWSDFADVPPTSNLPFKKFPKRDFTRLPTVSFVVPNQVNDMHSGVVNQADRWLQKHLGRYARWSRKHNSLLVVTWDEGSDNNHIPTIVYGANVDRGNYDPFVHHYSLLRTIEDMYGLAPLGGAAQAPALTQIFGVSG
jgi:hypothetical protein